jgi:AcrR family transcriptional regulator
MHAHGWFYLIVKKEIMMRNGKKKQIMRVVERLSAKRTLYEITLDEVAKEAKIGKGTIYHYFNNKEDLFFEVATSGFDELRELLQQEVTQNTLFTKRFHNMCSRIAEFFANRQQLLKIMLTQASRTCWSKDKFREKWIIKRKQLVNTISYILSDGVSQGLIRSDISTDFLADSLLGMLRACVRDTDVSSDSLQRGEFLAQLFLNGASQANNNSEVLLSKHSKQQIDSTI